MVLLCVVVFAGCDSASYRGEAVVATVNGEAVTAEVFGRALALRRDTLAQELTERPEVLRAVEEGVLEELITRRLLLQEAARRGIAISTEAVERRLRVLAKGYTLADYKAMLTERGLSLEAFRARLVEDLTIEHLLDEALGPSGPPTPEVVEAYYRDHQGDLRRPVRVRTLHLVVATAEEARDLREAVLAGGDFAETARRHSLGPEAVRDGELGWVSPGQMPEAFDEVIFTLKPGEVSPVVASPYGYHLFTILEVEPEGLPTLEEARPAIVARLGAEAREQRARQWVTELHAQADVVVHRRGGEEKR